MASKKNILFVHIPEPSLAQKKSIPFFFPEKARITVISHDIPFDVPPLDSPLKNTGESPVSQALPCTGKINFSREMNAFISNVIQKINSTQAKAVLFDMPFQEDATLFQVLEAINLKKKITMGITRVIQGKKDSFKLPEFFFTLSTLCLIQWQVPHPDEELDTRPLWEISKKGIWNHFIPALPEKESKNNLFLSFVLSNPNIAHSHEMQSFFIPGKKSAIFHNQNPFIPMEMPYSHVEQLPGIPLWQALNNPAHLLLYLSRYTQKELFPMRVDTVTDNVFALGCDISFYFEKPENLPPGYLDEICSMVEAGGSVATKWVRYNLERAFLIAYAMENDVIVGNSSLKCPRKSFIKRINKISGMDFTYFLERGYTSVRPEYRALGVGAKLLGGLTARAEDHKIFSIISEDNTATQKMAIRNKTRKVVTYYSEQMGKSAGIWMPESMIDT